MRGHKCLRAPGVIIIAFVVAMGMMPAQAHACDKRSVPYDARRAEYKGVIVIDAGHQKKANLHKEPVGPGSGVTKPMVSGGTRGLYTGVPEYKITLIVAKKLRKSLENQGYKVYMVRTENDVDISNSRRAKFANSKKADLFIRLHCDGADNHGISGFLTLTPKKNKWTKDFYKESANAAKLIHKATLKTTKAKDRGIAERGDLTGFNYSKVPSVLFEMGLMTNKAEDKKLSTGKYQNKLVKGMVNGVNKYFASKKPDKELAREVQARF